MVTVVGRDPRFKKTCPNCGRELQFQKSDVRAGPKAKGYDEDHTSFITCPKCSKSVDVTSTYGTSSAEQYRQQEHDDADI